MRSRLTVTSPSRSRRKREGRACRPGRLASELLRKELQAAGVKMVAHARPVPQDKRRRCDRAGQKNAERGPMRFYSFQVVIEKEPEDEGYFAYSPTVPGCFSNGKTIEEARRNVREAIEQHLTGLLGHGQPVPQDRRLDRVEEISIGLPE